MKPVDDSNFWLNILFEFDNIIMKDLKRTTNEVIWIIDGQVSASLFRVTGESITKHFAAKRIVFSDVWNLNLRMSA
jgi:hypothetical protein